MQRWMLVGSLVVMASLFAGERSTLSSPATDVYYVAPEGKADGDGSPARPFPSAEVALARVSGGSTLIFRPGIYRGPIRVPLRCKGTSQHPTVLKSEAKWKAVVIGAEYHGIATDDNCDWVVVDGFEVMGARYDGIKMNGSFSTVRNCYVHNNAHMGIAMHDQKGGVIERNLIEFNGSHVQFHHGVYADGEDLTVRANIVRHNAAYGLHLYPHLKHAVIVNNLVYGHPRKPGVIVACPDGGGGNLIANNTIVANAGGVQVWDGHGEVVVNNILANNGPALLFDESTRNVTVEHNLMNALPDRASPSNLAGDPRFVDADRGAYWLRPDSPAIGKASRQRAPDEDFWGRPRADDRPVDIGCFAFVPSLAAPDARSSWYQNWPYRFAPSPKSDLPDLWAVPR
jgi:parallel beta-helix repeat protein